MRELSNVLILGDSYSTFEGEIPDGYRWFYDSVPTRNTDLTKLSQTWWRIVLDATGAELLLNSSFSGSTVCNTGYEGEDASETSFVTRLDRLINEGFFDKNRVDTVFVFGGTNDSWAGSPTGENKYSDWNEKDLYCAFPAFSYMIKRLTDVVDSENIIVILNDELSSEIAGSYKETLQHYNVRYISLWEIDKTDGHPGVLGMKQIALQILENL